MPARTFGATAPVAWSTPSPDLLRPGTRRDGSACGPAPRPRRDSARRVGAGPRQPVHGPLVGARPCTAAALSLRRPRRVDGRDRIHRGHRRGDRARGQGLLGRPVRLFPPPQAAGAAGLRARRADQVHLSAGADAGLGGVRAFRRSRRQGHPRRAARRADRRPRAARGARRELRAAPGARHRRRDRRPAAGAGGARLVRRQLPDRVLACRHPRDAGGAADRRRRRRAGPAGQGGSTATAASACTGPTRSGCRPLTGVSSRSPPC